jgi:two-component system, OmpR family, response regulator CpxR
MKVTTQVLGDSIFNSNNTTHRLQILICDDDVRLTQLIRSYLDQHSINVTYVESGELALDILKKNTHALDALVLDVMLPGIDGLTTLENLRQFSSIPVLMLSARGEPIDRVRGLELGADDYLSKPYYPKELVARLNRITQRRKHTSLGFELQPDLIFSTFDLRISQSSAWVAETPLLLTTAEHAVLLSLALKAGKYVSREELTISALRRPLEKYDRAIDVHVSRLRKKLQLAGAKAPAIVSGRGAGYILVKPGTVRS